MELVEFAGRHAECLPFVPELRFERVAPLPSDEEGEASEFSFCLSEPSLGVVSEAFGGEPLLFQVAKLRVWRVRSVEYGSRLRA